METESNKRVPESGGSSGPFADFRGLSRRILHLAHLAQPRMVFLQRVLELLLDFFECDGVELRLKEAHGCIQCELLRHPDRAFNCRTITCSLDDEGSMACGREGSHLGLLCREILCGRFEPASQFFTPKGSFATGDTHQPVKFGPASEGLSAWREFHIMEEHRSLAIIPLTLAGKRAGLFLLRGKAKDFFTEEKVALGEAVGETISAAYGHHQTEAALRERVKELTCLYDISKIVQTPLISLEEILEQIVGILPPAWQYPDITYGRIILDRRTHGRAHLDPAWQKQSADIVVRDMKRGVVEVAYSKEMPELEEGPFLREERNLIEIVAIHIAQILEQRKVEEDRKKLQDQLRHADRLATIGQLAAGVAHEFNEPLGNILGFAELLLKNENLPAAAREDIGKIVSASMHAREVVRKLMWFAREMPARMIKVNLNTVAEEGLYLLEARCGKAGIEMERVLAPDLPDITADPAQLHQVLMNLVVNAIQAMPEGGTITVTTSVRGDNVSVIVQDTGIGMDEEVKKQIFIPFFTTKDIDKGTGLGLAVVHGIVTSHGGTIEVSSKSGEGSRFEVRLPIGGSQEAGAGSGNDST